MNKNFLVKILSGAGALTIMLNITSAILMLPALASVPRPLPPISGLLNDMPILSIPITLPQNRMQYQPPNFSQPGLNLGTGEGFKTFMEILYAETINLNKNIACTQAERGKNLLKHKDFREYIINQGWLTQRELDDAILEVPSPRMLSQSIYSYLAKNHKVWSAVFKGMVNLGLTGF